MLQCESAAGPHLRFVAWRKLDRNTGSHGPRDAWFQGNALDSTQVQTGILFWAVRITGKMRFGVQLFDPNFHGGNPL